MLQAMTIPGKRPKLILRSSVFLKINLRIKKHEGNFKRPGSKSFFPKSFKSLFCRFCNNVLGPDFSLGRRGLPGLYPEREEFNFLVKRNGFGDNRQSFGVDC